MNFTTRDAETLMHAKRKQEKVCAECGDSCHPDNSKANFFQWQQNQLCDQCENNSIEVSCGGVLGSWKWGDA